MKTYRADKDSAAYEAGYRRLLGARGMPAGLDRAMFEEKEGLLFIMQRSGCHTLSPQDRGGDDERTMERNRNYPYINQRKCLSSNPPAIT